MACSSGLGQKQDLIVVITDSRGKGLEEEITAQNPIDFQVKVLVYPGSGIIKAVKDSEKLLNWWRPKQIYILNGICDITTKSKTTKQVSLREADVGKAVQSIMDSVDTVTHFLKILMDGSQYQLIFAEIVGMNISTYNYTAYPDPQQGDLNTIVERVNAEIVARNTGCNVSTPWTAREVHRNMKNGRKSHRYQKLAEDGLHLSPEMKKVWAQELIKTMYKNK